MSIFSMDHFYDGWEKSNAGKLSTKLSTKFSKVIGENKSARISINGCGYYLIPLYGKRYGFGSGNLELVFNSNDENAIKEKLFVYFSKNYSTGIMFGGCTVKKEDANIMNHLWKDIENCQEKELNKYDDAERIVELCSYICAIDHSTCYEVSLTDKRVGYIRFLYQFKELIKAKELFDEYVIREL